MNCRNCEHDKLHTDYFSGDQYHFCRKYLDNIDPNKANKCKDYKGKTRGDKIRSMTDEELSNILVYECFDCNKCPSGRDPMDDNYGKCNGECFKHCLEWIKGTAEE